MSYLSHFHFLSVFIQTSLWILFSRLHATLQPILSIGRSVGRSHFTFFMILFLWPHCSCPNGLVTSNMSPAHPHATSVAVYLALFFAYLLFRVVHAGWPTDSRQKESNRCSWKYMESPAERKTYLVISRNIKDNSDITLLNTR